MRVFLIFTLLFISFLSSSHSQNIEKYSFQVDQLSDNKFVDFTKEQLEHSQFIFVGEQHGIAEVGLVTNALYNLAKPFGYNTLCVETDAIAAKKIFEIASSSNPIAGAKALSSEFPFAIPFYNNEDDYELFKNVVRSNGNLWGIDQTFMVQFRLNFDYLINSTTNKTLKTKLLTLKNEAHKSYMEAIRDKNFNSTYIFKYNETTHDSLMQLASNNVEREVFNQLWKTKEIYAYNNITKEYYKNNSTRANLMKSNFMQYYNAAKEREKLPKVIFKLGANHAARGLTRTNVFDISNMCSELAISNGFKSVNYIVMGIKGDVAVGNPFTTSPIIPFNNVAQFPKEIQDAVASIGKKYYVLDLISLRPYAYGSAYSDAFKKIIFGYDVLILVNNARAIKVF